MQLSELQFPDFFYVISSSFDIINPISYQVIPLSMFDRVLFDALFNLEIPLDDF
jgi:hypothetical protein